jgi:hypothetical protein
VFARRQSRRLAGGLKNPRLLIFDARDGLRIARPLQGIPNVRGAPKLITQMISQEKDTGTNSGNDQQNIHAYNLYRISQSVLSLAIGVSVSELNTV